MLLYGVLVFLLAVLSGAMLNVVSASLGLGLIPGFPGSQWFFFTKNLIATMVLWTIVISLFGFGVVMFRERRRRKQLVTVSRPARQPLPQPTVAVALTAYNDELSIVGAVHDFNDQPGVQTVIVVDNNCRDETALLAAAAGATVVREPLQGYGHACRRGLRAALDTGAEVIVLSEGDGTFSGHDIAKLVPFLADADMVMGNRITPGLVDRQSQMDTFFVWGNQLGAKLLQLRFWDWRFMGKVRISDLGCTYRAIRREALADILDELHVGGSHFSPEMIMVALRKGQTVIEVPVTFWPRVGVSKGASNFIKAFAIGISMFWMILSFPMTVQAVLPERQRSLLPSWWPRR